MKNRSARKIYPEQRLWLGTLGPLILVGMILAATVLIPILLLGLIRTTLDFAAENQPRPLVGCVAASLVVAWVEVGLVRGLLRMGFGRRRPGSEFRLEGKHLLGIKRVAYRSPGGFSGAATSGACQPRHRRLLGMRPSFS